MTEASEANSTEIVERLANIEAYIAKIANRPVVNPMETIGKLLESEVVQGAQDKAQAFEEFVHAALKDIYNKVDRIEQKCNLIASQVS